MTRRRRRLVATLLLIAVMICSSLSVAAAAKKTVKNSKFLTSTSATNKKAAVVKKGTTNLTFTKGQGYVKFKAPKTKTYSFTFSNLTGGKYDSFTFVSVQKKYSSNKKYITLTKVKTAGGRTDFLNLSVNGKKDNINSKTIDKYLAKRTGKIKLKKGEEIYFHLSNSGSKTKMKLVIK